jgi:hypothetical protein
VGQGGKRLFGGALLICLCIAVGASPAAADDANFAPPSLELRSSGSDREPLGILSGSLAYYSTAQSGVSEEYPEGSSVSFACFIDGLPVECSKSYYRRCCPVRVPKRATRARLVPEGKTLGYGPFTGWVPIPPDLPGGVHSVTVIATDEDGADPNPPTVTAILDRTPPTAPRILTAPPKISRDQTPRFRFAASDDRWLRDSYNDPFSAQLQRIDSPGPAFHNGSPSANYLEWRGPFCPTPVRCTEVAWPAYSADGEGGATIGIREHLGPGLYELSVRANDIAGNESEATTYRFRVVGPRRR